MFHCKRKKAHTKLTSRGVDLHAKVELHETVKARQHTSARNASQNVGASAVHERHKALLLDDLQEAVNGAAVLLGLTRGHHHASSHRVHRVRDEARGDRYGVAEAECGEQVRVVAQQDWLESVVEAKVAATVDDDANARDHEATIETGNAVGGERLLVDVDETVELTLAATLLDRLGVVGETGTSVIERVHEAQRESAGNTTRRDVLAKGNGVRISLAELERCLDLILEGKVKCLRRKVTNAVGQVASPKWK